MKLLILLIKAVKPYCFWIGAVLSYGLLIFPTWANVPVDLADVEQRIKNVQQHLQQQQHQYDQLQQKLKQTETAIGRLTVQLHELTIQKQTKENQLNQLHQELHAQQQILQQQHNLMLNQLKITYLMQKRDYLKLAFQRQDPNQLSRLLTYYRYLHTARVALIEQIRHSVMEIEKKQTHIENEQQALDQLQQRITREKNHLVQQNEERAQVMKDLDQKIGHHQKQLDKLREDQRALTQLLLKIELERKQAAIAATNFTHLKGRLKRPIASNKIIQYFGKPLAHSDLTSTGIVFAAEEGSWVSAVAPGKVVFADWLRGFGLLIIISHNDGYMTLYGRNQSLYKQVGDLVSTGERIAQVGRSGGFSEPGLYFEIRQHGHPLNPEQWLSSSI